MSSHNICFRGGIRKILCGYPLLSVVMLNAYGLWYITVIVGSGIELQVVSVLDQNTCKII